MALEFENWARMFVALFVVMNCLPLLPLIMSMTHGLGVTARSRLLDQALLLGGGTGTVFVIVGPALLGLIGIDLLDLRIAGGILLLVFATHDLLFSIVQRKEHDVDSDAQPAEPALVPLAVPILVGPSTLTTLLVLSDAYGMLPTLSMMAANVAINRIILGRVHLIAQVLGQSMTMAFGKLFSLLLAAIAVSMIRVGVTGIINSSAS